MSRPNPPRCTRWPTVSTRSPPTYGGSPRSEEHTSELQSPCNLVCRLLLEKKKTAEVLTKRSAIDLLLTRIDLFATFVSRTTYHFFTDTLVLPPFPPASTTTVLTPYTFSTS